MSSEEIKDELEDLEPEDADNVKGGDLEDTYKRVRHQAQRHAPKEVGGALGQD